MASPESSASLTGGQQELFARVLMLEDDPAHAHLIKRALKGICSVIEHRDTLAAAVEEARQQRVDLIISDLNVPDGGPGVTVARLREAAPTVPLIVLTSSNSLRDAVDVMRLGADDFVVKDFDADFREVLGFTLQRLHTRTLLAAEKLKLEREMQALRSAIESSADGLAVAAADGVITYANTALHEYVRRMGGQDTSLATLLGASVVQRERTQRTLDEKRATLAVGAVWNTEVTLVGEGYAAFDLSLSVVVDAAGERGPKRFVIWMRDIQEQKRREKFQREILSTTTHDLKGPLGAIMLSAELLVGGGIPEQKAKDLAIRIGSSAQSAVNLIDEFLSARRIQEGAFVLKPQLVDVVAAANNVMETFSTMSQAKQVALKAHCSAQSLEWRVDRLGFERMLGNLVSNAIKFTPRGGSIEVGVEVADGRLHVRVKDSGSGMEASEVTRLFQRFSRLAKHGDIPGTGLGLFVVKNVVGAHGGAIDVTSQVGVGTTFDISFPADPPVNERGELIALDFA